MAADIEAFEAQRPRLTRLAYRMLGSVAEAEDVVQDAWLRWTRTGDEVLDPAGWLVRVTSRICIDRMRSAKAQREAYRGPWLPEPLIEELNVDPVERAEDVSVAFLLALERLSPLERAVFLLHDVFDEDYGSVAETLGRNEAAVRQLATRARAHVRDNRPRFTVSQEDAAKLAAAFMTAASQGDMAALSAVLAHDAVMVSDGGGKRKASLRPLIGREDIIRLLEGIAWRAGGDEEAWPLTFRAVRINGYPGIVMERGDGPMTVAFQPGEDGKLAAIYMVRNPDKLGHVSAD
ncbi:sigma-70 family RNA polymerase sigma factor [Phenylobacterium sp.]|uniref:sigma-70 family RNA polymerase sigma factor n=1 Tax=Phenylobacterium sp. TaxID=1871053 RepID=UPI00272F3314|nr:sigma-70 family RNA polymerase sigma factor [Phenylobacterium sp.]MDP1601405.1 sigma-70 family RNA polymerase sigma factor [Phenylobacterium sp.]MDP3593533.1 sigma-70 family RNA polymerase sigma factor [Phenylobacterium sp.]